MMNLFPRVLTQEKTPDPIRKRGSASRKRGLMGEGKYFRSDQKRERGEECLLLGKKQRKKGEIMVR